MPTRMKFRQNVERRQAGAKARQEARDARSDKQQLTLLDDLFGEGQGAERERTRLNKRIAKNKSGKASDKAAEETETK